MSRYEMPLYRTVLALCVVLFGYMATCALDYGDPVVYSTQEVRTPVVRQGETLRIFYRFTRLRSCELDRTRIVIDGEDGWHRVGRDQLPATGRPSAGREEEMEVRIPIGDDFKPGPALYRPILAYQCAIQIGPLTLPNLFQEYAPKVLILEDKHFTIHPRDAPSPG